MPLNLDPNRPVGFESRKSYARRCREGFWDAFMSPGAVLDIGYRGGLADALPIVPWAIGVELDHVRISDDRTEPWTLPNSYDGLHLPANDGQISTVYASHLLEHVHNATDSLREWFRTIKIGGAIIVIVPHAYLYERRLTVPPSRWSPEHVRSFTPASLLSLVESALEPNSYQVASLFTDDTGYDYSLPIDVHPQGCLEIICVIRKITKPQWNVEP